MIGWYVLQFYSNLYVPLHFLFSSLMNMWFPRLDYYEQSCNESPCIYFSWNWRFMSSSIFYWSVCFFPNWFLGVLWMLTENHLIFSCASERQGCCMVSGTGLPGPQGSVDKGLLSRRCLSLSTSVNAVLWRENSHRNYGHVTSFTIPRWGSPGVFLQPGSSEASLWREDWLGFWQQGEWPLPCDSSSDRGVH